MENVIEVRHYVNRAGKDVFDDWLTQLADAQSADIERALEYLKDYKERTETS
jgi:hypothetical protein